MKIIWIGLGLALWVTAARADLTVVQNLETSAMPAESGKASTMTMKMKGTKARIDFSGMPISSIIDLKSKQLFILDHKQKQVMAMPLEFMQSMLAMSAPETAGGSQKTTSIQKTGKVQSISGYSCEEYTMASDSTTIRCWVAKTSAAAEMEPFQTYAQGAFKTTSFGGMAAMKGLIVRSESTVMSDAKPVTSRTELKSLSQAPLPDAIFSLPQDYKMTGMPAFSTP